MKNRCILRKYAAIATLAVSAIVYLPVALFAQGAVIGYASGWKAGANPSSYPTNEQLNRLTHVIACEN